MGGLRTQFDRYLQLTHSEPNPVARLVRALNLLELFIAYLANKCLCLYEGYCEPSDQIERIRTQLAKPELGTYLNIIRTATRLIPHDIARSERDFLQHAFRKEDAPDVLDAFKVLAQLVGYGKPNRTVIPALELLDFVGHVRNRTIKGQRSEGFAKKSADPCCTFATALVAAYYSAAPLPLIYVQEVVVQPDSSEYLHRAVDLGAGWTRREFVRKVEERLESQQLYLTLGGEDTSYLRLPPLIQLGTDRLYYLSKFNPKGRSPFQSFDGDALEYNSTWDFRLKEFFEKPQTGYPEGEFQSVRGIINNLPPESSVYSTFVGREEYFPLLSEKLSPQRQTHIVVLDGIGGVGKTSLARRFAERALHSSEPSGNTTAFDYIIWASAKRTILTDTIQPRTAQLESSDTVVSYIAHATQTDELVGALEPTRTEGLNALLSSAKFLIILDNYETVPDKRKLWEFLLGLPAPTKILVTSRVEDTEGAICITVRELSAEESIEVFKAECKSIGLSSEKLSPTLLRKVADETGGVPVALKHVAYQLERGRDINFVLSRLKNHSGPLNDFCFREIFSLLDENSKKLWVTMGLFERPVYPQEVSLVTALGEDALYSSLDVLGRYKIVNRHYLEEGEVAYSCLPLTARFGRITADDPEYQHLRDGYQEYTSIVDRVGDATFDLRTLRVGTKDTTILRSELVARQLAREAQRSLNRGMLPEAEKRLEQAERISPSEPTIWFVRGEMHEANGDFDQAIRAYTQALSNTRRDTRVYKRIADLQRRRRRYADASTAYERIVEINRDDRFAWHLLGDMRRRKAFADERKISTQDFKALVESALHAFQNGYFPGPKTLIESHHNAVNAHAHAAVLARLNRQQEAKDVCEKGLTYEPDNQRLLDQLRAVS